MPGTPEEKELISELQKWLVKQQEYNSSLDKAAERYKKRRANTEISKEEDDALRRVLGRQP